MTTNIVLKPDQVGAPLGDLYGLFFEDLNHAADGGLYAELVQNRSFEFSPLDNKEYHHLTAWEDLAGGELSEETLHLRVLSNEPIHPQNNHYLKINTLSGIGIRNRGYNRGMFFKEDENYRFSFFVKPDFPGQQVTVQLQTKNASIAAEATIEITEAGWQKYQVLLTAAETTTEGRLALIFPAETDLAIDMVSLFPEKTFMGRENGCREDLCQLLAEMKPNFLRFPGGCLVHDGSLNASDRDSMYRWKNTVGPVETRATKRNGWGYNQSYGLGYYEYFILCEDLGAKPLPVLPGGWDPHHQRAVPMEEMAAWIEDALDLIEFANGSVETKWGGLRRDMGHPEPFNLEYLAIGNEEVGQEFFDRYDLFHEAIRKKHPEIKLINSAGPFSAGSEWQRGWDNARTNGSDLVDEHYYCSPEWFIANHHHYDHNDPAGPKVFLGEYAAKSNRWWSALAEATYMIGLERNADKVGLACYAPMLCNVDYCNWAPDLIWYDQSQSMGSVNYDIQKLFMQKQGTHNLAFEVENLPPAQIIEDQPITGMLSLKGDQAEIELENIQLVDEETGQVTKFTDIKLSGDQRLDLTSVTSEHYTVTFRFKKTGGQWDKGFKLFFGMKDEQNRYGWSLGGWQNQDCLIESVKNGSDSVLTQSIWQVVEDVVYDCQLEIKDRQIKTTINGEIFNETQDLPYLQEAAYINAVVDEEQGTQIVKLVNLQEEPFAFTLKELTGRSAKTTSLQATPEAENKLGTPNQVQTKVSEIVITEEPLRVPSYGVLFVEIK